MPDYFDTATLAASFDRRTAPGEDFLDAMFPNRFVSDSQMIVIDEVLDDERVAKYVSADVETPEGEKLEREARDYRPTYTKERDTIKASVGQVRRAGEPLNGVEGDAGNRLYDAIEDQLDTHHNRITRLEILQANQIVQTGKVTVTGDHAPNRVINFNRHAELSGAMGGASAWGAAGVSIVDNLEARGDKISEHGGGLASNLILGSQALALFRGNEEIRENLDIRRASDAELELNPTMVGKKNVLRRVGQVGDITVWKYVQSYVDASGTRQMMFPSLGSALVDLDEFFGIRGYGAIQDKKAEVMPLARFAKVWDKEDPAATVAMTQSAPLMIPGDVNACDFFTVA